MTSPMLPAHTPMASPEEVQSFVSGSGETSPPLDMVSPGEAANFAQTADDEEKYGGFGGAAKAAGLGVLRGASVSGSDVALAKSGLVDPKTIEGLQRQNPGISLTSEIGGAIGSAALGDELAPAALIGKAGKATYGALKVLDAAKGIQEASTAAKVLGATGDIAAHIGGSAVEGALYAGIGNTLNEYAVGDPNLNAEKIAANFGYGALAGGAIGGAIKAASIAAPPALQAAKDGLVKLKNTIIGSGEGDAGLVGKMLPDGSKFTEALSNRMTNLDVDQQAELLKSATNDVNEVLNNTQTAVKDLNTNLRPKETAALIDTADPKAVSGATSEVLRDINAAQLEMKNNPGLYNPGAEAKLEKWRLQLANNLEDQSPSARFELLKDVKQGLGNWGHGMVDTGDKADTAKLLKGLSNSISDKLKNPDIFGFVGSSYAEHDAMLSKLYDYMGPNGKPTQLIKGLMTNLGTTSKPRWQFDSGKIKTAFTKAEDVTGQQKLGNLNDFFDVLKQLPDHLENTHANVPNSISFDKSELSNMLENKQQSFMDAGKKYLENVKNQKGGLGLRDVLAGSVAMSHPIVGAAMEAYNIATKPFSYMNKLAGVERIVGKATNSIGQGAEAIFNPSLKIAGKAKGPIADFLGEDHDENVIKHDELRDHLNQMTNDPQMMIDHLNKTTGPLHSVAPDTTGALNQTIIKANQFLASKLPVPQQTNPFEAKTVPSKTELANFNRYYQIVEKPIAALGQIKNGTLGPETIETLQNVYPQLYAYMQQAVMKSAEKQVQLKEPIPYRIKQSMSLFLGQPIDQSLNPGSIAANQAAYITVPAPKDGTKPSRAGAAKLTLGERTGIDHGEMDT